MIASPHASGVPANVAETLRMGELHASTVDGPEAGVHDVHHRSLGPRLLQTLIALLRGLSEKEAAAQLGISRHTLHVYVKHLYAAYGVVTRAQLMARWIRAEDLPVRASHRSKHNRQVGPRP